MPRRSSKMRRGPFFLYIFIAVFLFVGSAGPTDSPAPGEICDEPADRLLSQGEWQKAVELHEKIVKRDPGFALARYHLGFAYGQMERYDLEVSEYQKAISLGLKKAELYYNLGIALGEAFHDYPGAIAAFQEAVQLKPAEAEFHYNLGLAYLFNQEKEAAEKELREAIRIEPKHVQARISIGDLYADRKELKKAEEEWQEALKIDPSNVAARENLKWLERHREDINEENHSEGRQREDNNNEDRKAVSLWKLFGAQ